MQMAGKHEESEKLPTLSLRDFYPFSIQSGVELFRKSITALMLWLWNDVLLEGLRPNVILAAAYAFITPTLAFLYGSGEVTAINHLSGGRQELALFFLASFALAGLVAANSRLHPSVHAAAALLLIVYSLVILSGVYQHSFETRALSPAAAYFFFGLGIISGVRQLYELRLIRQEMKDTRKLLMAAGEGAKAANDALIAISGGMETMREYVQAKSSVQVKDSELLLFVARHGLAAWKVVKTDESEQSDA